MTVKEFKLCGLKQAKNDGIIEFTLTSKTVDRDSEVVMPMGVKIDNFMKNPVFLWAHKLDLPPLGKILPDTIKRTEIVLDASVAFDMKDSFAEMIHRKYKEGFLSAGSIRFTPITVSEPIMQGQRGATIIESELLEFSAVPVPANPQALKKMLGGDDEFGIKNIIEQFYNTSKEPTPEGWVDMLNVKTTKVVAAWVRPIRIKSNYAGEQHLLAVFTEEKVVVPEDAKKLQFTDDGLELLPHPDAGKTFMHKTVIFAPGIKAARTYGQISFYQIYEKSGRDKSDIELISDKRWEVISIDEIVNRIEYDKKSEGQEPTELVKTFCEISDLNIEKMIKSIRKDNRAFDHLNDFHDVVDMAIKNRLNKTSITYRSHPISETEWDKEKALQNIKDFVENGNFGILKQSIFESAFGYADAFGGQKYLHHDIVDGKMVTVWKGLAQSMVELLGGKDVDKEEIYNHLAKHYEQFGKEPPEMKTYTNLELDSLDELKEYGEDDSQPQDGDIELSEHEIDTIVKMVINKE